LCWQLVPFWRGRDPLKAAALIWVFDLANSVDGKREGAVDEVD
jgi:hypothetical protein